MRSVATPATGLGLLGRLDASCCARAPLVWLGTLARRADHPRRARRQHRARGDEPRRTGGERVLDRTLGDPADRHRAVGRERRRLRQPARSMWRMPRYHARPVSTMLVRDPICPARSSACARLVASTTAPRRRCIGGIDRSPAAATTCASARPAQRRFLTRTRSRSCRSPRRTSSPMACRGIPARMARRTSTSTSRSTAR